MLLAGDIGGTKTLLQLAEPIEDGIQVLAEAQFTSNQYADLSTMASQFLAQLAPAGQHPTSACFAIAGPVKEGTADVTYLSWATLSETQLQDRLNIPRVRLINDFQGVGYGIDALAADDLRQIHDGHPIPQGTRTLLGAGTGLGVGCLVWQENAYRVLPSEGGHSDFAPRNQFEIELLSYLLKEKKRERVSYDDLLSGKGIVAMYEFLGSRYPEQENPALQADMEKSDPAACISEYALQHNDKLARRALDHFVQIYGAQAGNLALLHLSSGGVYIAGGIAPKLIELLDSSLFRDAFLAKAPMTDIVRDIPVNVIINAKVGLLGAMQYAREFA